MRDVLFYTCGGCGAKIEEVYQGDELVLTLCSRCGIRNGPRTPHYGIVDSIWDTPLNFRTAGVDWGKPDVNDYAATVREAQAMSDDYFRSTFGMEREEWLRKVQADHDRVAAEQARQMDFTVKFYQAGILNNDELIKKILNETMQSWQEKLDQQIYDILRGHQKGHGE